MALFFSADLISRTVMFIRPMQYMYTSMSVDPLNMMQANVIMIWIVPRAISLLHLE